MSKSKRRQKAEARQHAQANNFFKWLIIVTVVLVVLLYLFFMS